MTLPVPPPPAIGVVIPALNAGRRWNDCLAAIAAQTLRPHRLLVLDSESTDDTVTAALAAGFEVKAILRADFNHGGTRQLGAEHLEDCDVIVFLTQDAVLATPDALTALTQCFAAPDVAVAYGRQLPHPGATAIEAHARHFNYGAISERKDLAATARLGTKVFFCSDSFAAYRRSVLLSLGGFRDDLILGEDMEFAARAIKAGYANCYCAQATVYHSHDYSLWQTVRRYFDLGAFEAGNGWMREEFGSHRGEGLRFVKSELRYLLGTSPLTIPRALLQTAAKLLGYRLGVEERRFSIPWKRRLSMFPGFWR